MAGPGTGPTASGIRVFDLTDESLPTSPRESLISVFDFNCLFSTLIARNKKVRASGDPSFHRHTLRQIPRLIHIRPPRTRLSLIHI